MRLCLINPRSPLVSIVNVSESRWNRYRIWKPLGLLVVAGLTPPEWQISIVDENLRVPDYASVPRPDLVGITAFTSQATRAYEVADEFHRRGVRVVMGGIHATMCQQEALQHADSIVTGEAESVWAEVLSDARQDRLRPIYVGGHADAAGIPPARHDLLQGDYAFGAIQTTRGCPLNCDFCSVSAFNGTGYRLRPIANVIQEFRSIPEKRVLVVDDNLIGISAAHISRAKDLFRAMIQAEVNKDWMAQVTVNMADDEELLRLAARAGCQGVFIGFESPTAQGLAEVGKKFNLRNDRNFQASVRRIQRHKILVVGSFILGLDTDEPGIGSRIATAARHYGVDILNALFLTPLPGTRLWDRMKSQDRIAAADFPRDWQYYTLGFPTALYKRFSWADIVAEMVSCERQFYGMWQIIGRVVRSFLWRRHPCWSLVSNLSCRNNARLARRRFSEMGPLRGSLTQAPA